MRHLVKRLVQTAQVTGQLVLAFMVVTICYDAIMRYVFTAPTSWSLEVNTFPVVYLAVMTAAGVQRTEDYICLTFFANKMGAAWQRIVRAVICAVGTQFLPSWPGTDF